MPTCSLNAVLERLVGENVLSAVESGFIGGQTSGGRLGGWG